MSEMVDRMARAMYAASRAKDYVPQPDGYVNEYDRRMARAALEAMREPTEEMLTAEGENEMGTTERLGEYLDFWDAKGVWKAMVNAALIDK
jgi:hypothetical protein